MKPLRHPTRCNRVLVLLAVTGWCEVAGLDVAIADDESALSAGKLKLPKGPGSLEGVGENVDVNFQMGQMTFGILIAVPSGHSGLTPSLVLTGSSGGGQRLVEQGWPFGIEWIERVMIEGLRRYTTADQLEVDRATELVGVASSRADEVA